MGKVTLTGALRKKSRAGDGPAAFGGEPLAARPAHGASGAVDPFDFSALSWPAGRSGDTELARAGFSGSPAAFPHRDAIERSFGRSLPATAYLDQAAAQSSAALGAHGYALGDQVAFASATPSLEVAAHEAAHVLQATSGVQLHGGDGAYEAHADAVAARVVQGASAADLLTDGPVAAAAVRRQTVPNAQLQSTQTTSTATSTATSVDPSATSQTTAQTGAQGTTTTQGSAPAAPTPLARVQAAIAASDLPGLIAIQRELVQQLAPDPAHPPADVREGLTAARRWIMEQVAAIRDRYVVRLATAAASGTTPADPATRTDATPAVEAVEISMDTECTPYLDALLAGDPQVRYQHADAAVTEKVFAAVRLHSTRRGIGQIGHRAEAEAEARDHGGVATESWCGAFAFTQAEQGGGFDSYWAENMQGEGGIRAALAYGHMHTLWLWAGDQWVRLRDYHASRGSERWYEAVDRAPPSRGIQPGDLVLIDNAFGTNPDHIATAISFDGRYLTTVGGNQGSGELGVSRSGTGPGSHPGSQAFDLQANPTANDVSARDASGHALREVDPHAGPKHLRVHGIGRWSIVDYERHIYRRSDTLPTAPPTARETGRVR